MKTRQARHLGAPTSAARTRSVVRIEGHDPHTHDHPQLIYVVNGSVLVHLPSRTISLPEGSGLWLETGVRHAVSPQRHSIMLGPRLSEMTHPPEDHLVIAANKELSELALFILAMSPTTSEETEPFRRSLDALLLDIVAEDFPTPGTSRPDVCAIAADPQALLLPVRSLALKHSLSTRHLERIFKESLGVPFVTWRTQRRMNLALARIRAGASASAAARAVGYDSSDGLVKAIQRHTGLERKALRADMSGAVRTWARTQSPTGVRPGR